MKIAMVTPANLGSQTGNNITAVRWASILNKIGHEVSIANEYSNEEADLMIALNAYRSRTSILTFRDKYPDKPLIVALTGTDLYRFMNSHPQETLQSIEAADRLIVLNNLAVNVLPLGQQHKVYLIYESAKPLANGRRPIQRYFDICLFGHLRPEKNPLLAAIATRNLPESSRIRIRHYGKAHTEEWAKKARNEMLKNKRYTWFGEVPHWQVREALAKCKLMVLTSNIEGGPNTLSEAIVARVPVITTSIDGCVGVLGQDYPGYFPVEDSEALTVLFTRVETDVNFLEELERYIVKIEPQFSLLEEELRWTNFLKEIFSKTKREQYG